MSKKNWFVLARTTGQMDGFYADYDRAVASKQRWEERMPEEVFYLCETPEPLAEIPDDRFLPIFWTNLMLEKAEQTNGPEND